MTTTPEKEKRWDVFISHASEDKETFVRPLVIALSQLGVDLWFDEFELEIGDSISRSIDEGLGKSNYGLVVLSPAFLKKAWPDYELRGLISRELGNNKVILPIWHGVTRKQILNFSPSLADKLAIDSSEMSASDVAIKILRVIRPDLYEQHPRAQLEKMVNGEAIRELQAELERTKEQLEAQAQKIEECPYCKAPLANIGTVDHVEEHAIVTYKTFACGYSEADGFPQKACPKGPALVRVRIAPNPSSNAT
jgi:hypothetical protein